MANRLASADHVSGQLPDVEEFVSQADHMRDASLSGGVDVSHMPHYFIFEFLRGRKAIKKDQCLVPSQIFINLVAKEFDV